MNMRPIPKAHQTPKNVIFLAGFWYFQCQSRRTPTKKYCFYCAKCSSGRLVDHPKSSKMLFLLQDFDISEGLGAERRNKMLIFAVGFSFFESVWASQNRQKCKKVYFSCMILMKGNSSTKNDKDSLQKSTWLTKYSVFLAVFWVTGDLDIGKLTVQWLWNSEMTIICMVWAVVVKWVGKTVTLMQEIPGVDTLRTPKSGRCV